MSRLLYDGQTKTDLVRFARTYSSSESSCTSEASSKNHARRVLTRNEERIGVSDGVTAACEP